uniref:SH2 domain-containing protein n=1 Tax=Steinernema glaseri TaxID=37863 RepID=A0A1I8AEU6_9BILA
MAILIWSVFRPNDETGPPHLNRSDPGAQRDKDDVDMLYANLHKKEGSGPTTNFGNLAPKEAEKPEEQRRRFERRSLSRHSHASRQTPSGHGAVVSHPRNGSLEGSTLEANNIEIPVKRQITTGSLPRQDHQSRRDRDTSWDDPFRRRNVSRSSDLSRQKKPSGSLENMLGRWKPEDDGSLDRVRPESHGGIQLQTGSLPRRELSAGGRSQPEIQSLERGSIRPQKVPEYCGPHTRHGSVPTLEVTGRKEEEKIAPGTTERNRSLPRPVSEKTDDWSPRELLHAEPSKLRRSFETGRQNRQRFISENHLDPVISPRTSFPFENPLARGCSNQRVLSSAKVLNPVEVPTDRPPTKQAPQVCPGMLRVASVESIESAEHVYEVIRPAPSNHSNRLASLRPSRMSREDQSKASKGEETIPRQIDLPFSELTYKTLAQAENIDLPKERSPKITKKYEGGTAKGMEASTGRPQVPKSSEAPLDARQGFPEHDSRPLRANEGASRTGQIQPRGSAEPLTSVSGRGRPGTPSTLQQSPYVQSATKAPGQEVPVRRLSPSKRVPVRKVKPGEDPNLTSPRSTSVPTRTETPHAQQTKKEQITVAHHEPTEEDSISMFPLESSEKYGMSLMSVTPLKESAPSAKKEESVPLGKTPSQKPEKGSPTYLPQSIMSSRLLRSKYPPQETDSPNSSRRIRFSEELTSVSIISSRGSSSSESSFEGEIDLEEDAHQLETPPQEPEFQILALAEEPRAKKKDPNKVEFSTLCEEPKVRPVAQPLAPRADLTPVPIVTLDEHRLRITNFEFDDR